MSTKYLPDMEQNKFIDKVIRSLGVEYYDNDEDEDGWISDTTVNCIKNKFQKVSDFSARRARDKAIEDCVSIARKLLDVRNNAPEENIAYSEMVIEFDRLKSQPK